MGRREEVKMGGGLRKALCAPFQAFYGQFEKVCLSLYANGKNYIKIEGKKKNRSGFNGTAKI